MMADILPTENSCYDIYIQTGVFLKWSTHRQCYETDLDQPSCPHVPWLCLMEIPTALTIGTLATHHTIIHVIHKKVIIGIVCFIP